MICLSLEVSFAELFFFEEGFVIQKTLSDDAFNIFFRGWWQIVFSLNDVANCSKWSSLVQEEAQYILLTINNMVSVGIVENCIASYLWFYKAWSWYPKERAFH